MNKFLKFSLAIVVIVLLILTVVFVLSKIQSPYDSKQLETIKNIAYESAKIDLGEDCIFCFINYNANTSTYYVGYTNSDDTFAKIYMLYRNTPNDTWKIVGYSSRMGSDASSLFSLSNF